MFLTKLYKQSSFPKRQNQPIKQKQYDRNVGSNIISARNYMRHIRLHCLKSGSKIDFNVSQGHDLGPII